MTYEVLFAPADFLEMAICGCDTYVKPLHLAAARTQPPCLREDEARAEIREVEALRSELSKELVGLGGNADVESQIYESRRPWLKAVVEVALTEKRRALHLSIAKETDPKKQEKLRHDLRDLDTFQGEHAGILTRGEGARQLKLTFQEIGLLLDEL